MRLTLYQQYLKAIEGIPQTGRFMPYRWCLLPQPLNGRWIPYSQMLDEFSRGLANVINDLTHYERRLRAWAAVVAPLQDHEKLEATHEFIDVLAAVAVNLPYVIRSRFTFAVAHLCHQANRTKEQNWVDDLRWDGELDQSDADRRGSPWRRYRRLKVRLEKINGKEFVKGTRNFRNVYTHRIEPRFVIGLSQIVTREVLQDGRVVYAVGGQPPLGLSEVADLLIVQRDRCYLAFEAFQELVGEQVEAIAPRSRVVAAAKTHISR